MIINFRADENQFSYAEKRKNAINKKLEFFFTIVLLYNLLIINCVIGFLLKTIFSFIRFLFFF